MMKLQVKCPASLLRLGRETDSGVLLYNGRAVEVSTPGTGNKGVCRL